jgi:hypothetical protein
MKKNSKFYIISYDGDNGVWTTNIDNDLYVYLSDIEKADAYDSTEEAIKVLAEIKEKGKWTNSRTYFPDKFSLVEIKMSAREIKIAK